MNTLANVVLPNWVIQERVLFQPCMGGREKKGGGGKTDGVMVGTGKVGTHQEVLPAGYFGKLFNPCDPVRLCVKKESEVSEVSYVVEGSTRQRKVSVVPKCIQHAQVDVNLDGQSFAMQMSSSIS